MDKRKRKYGEVVRMREEKRKRKKEEGEQEKKKRDCYTDTYAI